MKLLGLFRHAKSSWEDVCARDFDRQLNNRGRKGAALMGRHIRDHGVAWQTILASPATRVRETLDAASAGAGRKIPITWNDRIYLAGVPTLMDILRSVEGDPEAVLLCGHNPGLQELVFELVPDSADNPLLDRVATKFPTAAFAVIELDIDKWEDAATGCGRLVHLARPRDLDSSLGPQAA